MDQYSVHAMLTLETMGIRQVFVGNKTFTFPEPAFGNTEFFCLLSLHYHHNFISFYKVINPTGWCKGMSILGGTRRGAMPCPASMGNEKKWKFLLHVTF